MAKIRDDLVGSVLIDNPEGGDPIVLLAGDKVPEGVELGDHVLAPKGGGNGSKGKSKGKDTGAAGKSASEPGAASGDALTVPPMVGKGSSAADWRVYALAAAEKAGLSIEIPEDAKRADIISALEGAEIPVK
ncbi:hypothetical protein [Microbacterium sp.]|uniref:hypothetical protein n=1 Tax=Microbacterium sp. TaxID=51671 RepID=UPI0039E40279